jgi:hypothetical protein
MLLRHITAQFRLSIYYWLARQFRIAILCSGEKGHRKYRDEPEHGLPQERILAPPRLSSSVSLVDVMGG